MNRHSAPASQPAEQTVPLPAASPRIADAAPSILGRRWGVSVFRVQVWVLTLRSLRIVFGDVRLVFFGLLQPIVLLVLFSQVFKGIGSLPSIALYHGYINFLMPATLINVAVTTAMSSGAGLLAEIYTGFVGRLRTMPIFLSSVLLARTLVDAVRLAAQVVVTTVIAIVFLGFRPAGFVAMAEASALTVLVGWGLAWIFVAIATWQRKLETMQAMSFIVLFPLLFGSNAYMPPAAMPAWIRVVATANPLTYAISATRSLALGQPLGSSLLMVIGFVTATALIGGVAAARNFRRTR
jgi:ABC-2 type transport system permease protein